MLSSHRAQANQNRFEIKRLYDQCGYLADPHTATGVRATETLALDSRTPVVTLATAHPAKFPDSIVKAGLTAPRLPPHLSDLLEREERFEVLDHDIDLLKAYILKRT